MSYFFNNTNRAIRRQIYEAVLGDIEDELRRSKSSLSIAFNLATSMTYMGIPNRINTIGTLKEHEHDLMSECATVSVEEHGNHSPTATAKTSIGPT